MRKSITDRMRQLEQRMKPVQQMVSIHILLSEPGVPSPEQQLAQWEQEHGVKLPEAHRQYVLAADYAPRPYFGSHIFFLNLMKPPPEKYPEWP